MNFYATILGVKRLTRFLGFPLAAGLLLVPLLPLGLAFGTTSWIFAIWFLLHLLVLVVGAAESLRYLLLLCRAAGRARVLFFLLLTSILGAMLLQGTLPITARDALIHHLAVPKWWVQMGEISPLWWHEWSFYPMLINLGYTALLALHAEAFLALYHGLYLLLLAALVAAFLFERTENALLSLLMGLVVLMVPIDLRLATEPLVDLGLALFCTVALAYLVRWSESHQNIALVGCGVALGLALSTKYNALLAGVALGLAFLWIAACERLGVRKTFRAALIVLLPALIVFLPWLLKNFLWTGNPLYPLYNSIFLGSSGRPPGPGGLSPLVHRMALYGETLPDIVLLPLRVFLFGSDGVPRAFDGVLTPLYLLALVVLLKFRRPAWLTATWIYTCVYLLAALFLSSARIRYLAPLFGVLPILTGITISAVRERFRISPFLLAGALLLIQTGLTSYYLTQLFQRSETVLYHAGGYDRDSYLRTHLIEYSAIEFINSTLTPQDGVYLLNTGNLFYYYTPRVISGGHFSASLLMRWLSTTATADEFAHQFSESHLNYLLMHNQRTRELFAETLSDPKKILWNDFQSRWLEYVYGSNGYTLWHIRSQVEPQSLPGPQPEITATVHSVNATSSQARP
jgi:4-amino-4-deoxy-L-arabinose transferase-like glycosyltransferase